MAKKDTILIADDDRVFVTMVSDFLRKKGFNVLNAFDAMQALMFAQKSKPTAMLLDINMPGGTGMETLRKVRMMNTTALLPVVVVTASLDARTKDEATGHGADEFLTKPVDLEQQLLPALMRALDREGDQEQPKA
jgi:CheY-like chemotaxis protein